VPDTDQDRGHDHGDHHETERARKRGRELQHHTVGEDSTRFIG
jgi:hypothetical protein